MADELNNREKLSVILDFWLEHNREHLRENDKWRRESLEMGYESVAREFERIGSVTEESIHRIEHVRRNLHKANMGYATAPVSDAHPEHEHRHPDGAFVHRHIELHQIGVIRTVYHPGSTWEQMQEESGDCRIIVNERYKDGLRKLDRFRYVIVLFYMDMAAGSLSLYAKPPDAQGQTVGVFASRSPHRPNPVGLYITEMKGIAENVVTTGRIDAYDGTPLIDIKPYIEKNDSITGAGNGWLDDFGR